MTRTEIRKALYKQKPIAKLDKIFMGKAYYSTIVQISEAIETLNFEVPCDDMGEAEFGVVMPAKELGRWVVILPEDE